MYAHVLIVLVYCHGNFLHTGCPNLLFLLLVFPLNAGPEHTATVERGGDREPREGHVKASLDKKLLLITIFINWLRSVNFYSFIKSE